MSMCVFFLNCISTQTVFLCLPFVSSFLPFHLALLPSRLFRPACGCCLLFFPHRNQLQLWDTAGQERFRKSMVQHYYRNVHAVLFVYNVTCPTSFSSLASWVEECRKNSLGQEIPRWLLFVSAVLWSCPKRGWKSSIISVSASGSWWGIRVTSATPVALTARWARSGPWVSPRLATWCSLRPPPKTRRTRAQTWGPTERCCTSSTRWRTLSLLWPPSWRDRGKPP